MITRAAIFCCVFLLAARMIAAAPPAYLGFDANDYPGDSSLRALKQTFSFAGYWLNNPPGAKSNSWTGRRAVLLDRGFGFLVLFNGRTSNQLRSPANPVELGEADGRSAVAFAQREGFRAGTVIFLDQEEGGRMTEAQNGYIFAWVDAVIASSFRAGIYCSGIPAKEGRTKTIITADDIHEHAGARRIEYFVYNDACPPAPGCVYGENPPLPSASGILFAAIWQFAQSPRRHEFTKRCAATYNPDGNCYAPGATGGSAYVDLNSATSPDPSNGRL
jgi:Domain of unknown function (DUF1906)